MVAPIQTRIGDSTIDRTFLDELKSFYNKPENEGKMSEFVAQNGEKFRIEDASFLARIASNFLAGKLDKVDEIKKSISQKANLNLNNSKNKTQNTSDKNSDSTASSSTSTDTTASADTGSAIQITSPESALGGEAAVQSSITASENQGEIIGKIDTNPKRVVSSSTSVLAQADATNQTESAKDQAQTQQAQTSQTQLKQSYDESKQKLNNSRTAEEAALANENSSLQSNKQVAEALKLQVQEKLKAKQAEKKSGNDSGDAQKQTGSKFGFEGTLATEADAAAQQSQSTADESSKKAESAGADAANLIPQNDIVPKDVTEQCNNAWKLTMQGPSKIQADCTLRCKEIPQETAKLADADAAYNAVKSATDAQVNSLNQNALANTMKAQGTTAQAQQPAGKAKQDRSEAVTNAVTAVAQCAMGAYEIYTGQAMVAAAACTFGASAAAGAVMVAKGIGDVGMGVATGVKATSKNKEAKNSGTQAGNLNQKTDDAIKGSNNNAALAAQKQAEGELKAQQARAAIIAQNEKTIAETNKRNAEIAQINANNQQKADVASKAIKAILGYSELSPVQVKDKKDFEKLRKTREDQIMTHEEAHAAIIGGTPVVVTDASGMPIGGYVTIDVPSVDQNNLGTTISKAQRVIDAALAPSDPSSQDMSIASQAKNVIKDAQSLIEAKQQESDKNKTSEKTAENKKDEDNNKDEEKEKGEKHLDGLVAKALDIFPKKGLARDNNVKSEADVSKLKKETK